MKIVTKRLDKLFSLYIRTRDHWTCRRCGNEYTPPTNCLQCSHIFTRGGYSTRWDENNAVALCGGCHIFLDKNPLKKYAFYKEEYGEEQYDKLVLKHNYPAKVDQGLMEIYLTRKLEELEVRDGS